MLSALSVRNIVLIDQLDLAFEDGLIVLTGETGAGKSILLDALTLALGGRGDQSLVREGADSGQVVAVFMVDETHPARVLLRESDIHDDAELILRRVQHSDGRTRAMINDQPVSAGLMRQIGSMLVEIHGQHDDRALVDVATHRSLLDAHGRLEDLVGAVRDAYKVHAEAASAERAQARTVEQAAREEEFARHAVDELSAFGLEEGEEDRLSDRRHYLMQLEKAADEVRDADEILNGPAAPDAALGTLLRRLQRKAATDGALFQPLLDGLEESLDAIGRAQQALEQIQRDMDFDPHELEKVEERLFALRALARKHGTSCDGLRDVLARYQADLETLQSGEVLLTELKKKSRAALDAYHKAAGALSSARSVAAESLSAAVHAELPDLKLGNARFIVDHQVDESREAASGYDQMAFHVQTNPGTAAGPMMKVASGGELSRFLLALKVVLADRGSAPVLIFDEIDTGVGGAVADAMGRRLARLSETVQVLTVTHAPQVAARADRHMLIEKQLVDEGAFTRTHVRPLDEKGRGEEIARMLAGAEVTEEARAAARRLISEVG